MGYGVRRDSHIMGGGGGGGPANSPSSPVSTWTRKAKVYELKGSDPMYQVDYCGSFQPGNSRLGMSSTTEWITRGSTYAMTTTRTTAAK